ncbi:Eukaryotic translation initiation factor isoform 4G-1 [Symbiodinium microadriaticum]|uniref:Eukaryotic translation initiation factor isoform 4G-1 n=1 Tax=Symbiodinium microadriaticum TaxID=2951 RepID=A0A1Q9DSW5_SYMMI|nr:Eukaryotic translation initiation factor isoform 4G-1 [Symbiodinium microadriaticum]
MFFRFLLVLPGLCFALRQAQVTKDEEAGNESQKGQPQWGRERYGSGWWECWCSGVQKTTFHMDSEPECAWRCREHCTKVDPEGSYASCHFQQVEYVSDSDDDWPSPSGRGDSTTSVARSIRAVLNKLTLEKFHQLYEQLFSSGIRRPEHVQILLKEVFDKAQVQHPFLPMYADLCARLAADARVTAACPSSEDCFARILLDMCQSCFAQLLAAEDDRPGSFE